MKCKYCDEILLDGEMLCTRCKKQVRYIKYKTAIINWFLIIVNVILILVLFNLSFRIFAEMTVKLYLNKCKYSEAASLISKYDFLMEKQSIEDRVTLTIVDLRACSDSKIEDVIKDLDAFVEIENDNINHCAQEAKEYLIARKKLTKVLESADNALRQNKFAYAFSIYQAYEYSSDYERTIIDSQLDNVLELIKEELSLADSQLDYFSCLDEIGNIVGVCQNNEFKEEILSVTKEYLSNWIENKQTNYNYVGANGAIPLSIKYDSIFEDSGLQPMVVRSELNYQSFIQERIDAMDYATILTKLDNDYDNICRYSDYLNPEVYNEYRVICACKLLETARVEQKYIGSSGAIDLCNRVNSYKENTVDKNTIIQEYTTLERGLLIQWINSVRKSRGLSELNENSILESIANEILPSIVNNSFDQSQISNTLEANGISFETVYWAFNVNSASSATIIESLKPIEDYAFLTENEVTSIGIGMIYDESNNSFSWHIIAIKDVLLKNNIKESIYKIGKVITKEDDLNVRQSPTTESEKIGTIAKGSTVTIVSEINGWYEIEFNGETGYVSGEFIQQSE